MRIKEDQQALYEAMEAAVLMANLLRTVTPEEIGIMEISPATKEVPLFEVKGDRLIQAGITALPQDKGDAECFCRWLEESENISGGNLLQR